MDVVLADGQPACVMCLKRPKRWTGKRWQSYCRICQTEYSRRWREGRTSITVTNEQKQLIRQLLAAKPLGRHHAR
jgi:hypothetical protein